MIVKVVSERMPRITELDGMRGIMSLIVVTAHIYPGPIIVVGVGCMDIFFCISGFLISRIVMNGWRGPGFLTNYLIRRTIRIWPLYYIVFAVCGLLSALLNHIGAVEFAFGRGSLQTLFFLQNTEYYWGENPSRAGYVGLFEHSWSVAIEEQFYVLVALAVLFRKAFVDKDILSNFLYPGLAAALAISVGSRLLGLHWWTLVGRLDGFILGIALALLQPYMKKHPTAWQQFFRVALCATSLIVGAMAVAKFVLPDGNDMYPLLVSFKTGILASALLAFALLGMIVSGANIPFRRLLKSAPLVRLGEISYSTYLWHFPIVTLIAFRAGSYSGHWARAVGTYALVLSVAFLSHRYIEKPLMRLRYAFPYGARLQTRAQAMHEAVSASSGTAD